MLSFVIQLSKINWTIIYHQHHIFQKWLDSIRNARMRHYIRTVSLARSGVVLMRAVVGVSTNANFT